MKDKATTAQPEAEVVSFHKDDIIANSKRLFNQPPEVVAGALHDVTGTITIEQAADGIKKYLMRPIKQEGGK